MCEYTWIGNGVFTVAEFLSAAECDDLVALSESLGYDEAPLSTSLGAVMRKDIRSNDRVVLDNSERAANLWQRARDFVPHRYQGRNAVGLNERMRFYRYGPGQQFDWHRDGYFERQSGERSLITVLVYLNDKFFGGETSFDEPEIRLGGPMKIVPQTGLALFFDHPLLHKGEPVEVGRKYALRTDVMYSAR
jgi:hypothetical protein